MPCAIVERALALDEVVDQVRAESCGAIVAFLGVVREYDEDGRAVRGLSYEAHRELALAEMETIVADAQVRFGDVRLAIVHRLGELAVGEASVAIAASAAHRATAFDACEFAIDQLKVRVPIWKKEHYRDGEARWRENPA
ncbi:MAG: molybdenum cofactor biosynthesis protein MoaE [Vulcanimicrobiaceae bacterium]